MIAARQIAFGGSKRKPYDAEIEYLESTGTQYIDTGYITDQCPYFSLDVQPLVTNVDCAFFGAYTSGYAAQQIDGIWRWYDMGWTKTGVLVDITRFSNILRSTDGWFVDGQYTRSAGVRSGKMNLFLFTRNTSSGAAGSRPARVRRLSLFGQDNSLVADFIPVRVGDVGYMYDKVSGKLFGNAGTGAFVLGSEAVSVNGGGMTADV